MLYFIMSIKVVYYADLKGNSPVRSWLLRLPNNIKAKAYSRIMFLSEWGHKLARPHAAYLENGIYELRWRFQKSNYRILYFFHLREAVILIHGFTKEDKIPQADLELALRRKQDFEQNPQKHTYQENN